MKPEKKVKNLQEFLLCYEKTGTDYMNSLPKITKPRGSFVQIMDNLLNKESGIYNFFETFENDLSEIINSLNIYNNDIIEFINLNKEAFNMNGEFNPEKLILTKGNLLNIDNISFNKNENGDYEFTWDNNSGIGNANENDNVLIVGYNVNNNSFSSSSVDGVNVKRNDLNSVILPSIYNIGDQIYFYIITHSIDNKLKSNTIVLSTIY